MGLCNSSNQNKENRVSKQSPASTALPETKDQKAFENNPDKSFEGKIEAKLRERYIKHSTKMLNVAIVKDT